MAEGGNSTVTGCEIASDTKSFISRNEASIDGATVLNANGARSVPQFVATQSHTAFVSGPLEPSSTYFADYYAPRISFAIRGGDSFLLGPSRGIDTLALNFLLSKNVPRSRIHVYMFETEARNKKGRVETLEKMGIQVCVRGKSHTQRDRAMTEESDYDILKYLTRKECMELCGNKHRERVSGTELNERRRAAKEESSNRKPSD